MTVETARQILICGVFLIVGLNLAVFVEAPRIVAAVAAWRVYMVGQICVDAALIYGLHKHLHNAIGRGVVMVGIGVGLTLISGVMLERAYHRKREQQGGPRSLATKGP